MSATTNLPMLTRRTYMILKASEGGCGIFMAAEAVSSTAIEHPEWDMDERRTWREWESALS